MLVLSNMILLLVRSDVALVGNALVGNASVWTSGGYGEEVAQKVISSHRSMMLLVGLAIFNLIQTNHLVRRPSCHTYACVSCNFWNTITLIIVRMDHGAFILIPLCFSFFGFWMCSANNPNPNTVDVSLLSSTLNAFQCSYCRYPFYS